MRDLMLKELQFSCGVVLDGEEVVPRFRIVTPEAVMVVFLPLTDEVQERARRMSLMRGWMAWKMATSFLLSAETKEPDGVTAIGVTRTDCWGVLRPIVRKPLSIGPEQWLTRAQIGEGFPELLPKGETTLDWGTIAELERTFGPQGKFPVQGSRQHYRPHGGFAPERKKGRKAAALRTDSDSKKSAPPRKRKSTSAHGRKRKAA